MSVDQVRICGEILFFFLLFFFSSFFFFPPFFFPPFWFLLFFFPPFFPPYLLWDGWFSHVTILFLKKKAQILTTSHFVVWVSRVTNIATAFGPPPNFQMEIKRLLLIHSLKKNPPIKIPRSAPALVHNLMSYITFLRSVESYDIK